MENRILVPVLGLALSSALTTAVCVFFDWPAGPTALLFFIVWPAVGLVLTIDDDLPGGWSNPDGTYPPPWKDPAFWAEIALRFVIVCAVFAFSAD